MRRWIGLHATRLLTAPRLRVARTGERRSELAIEGAVLAPARGRRIDSWARLARRRRRRRSRNAA